MVVPVDLSPDFAGRALRLVRPASVALLTMIGVSLPWQQLGPWAFAVPGLTNLTTLLLVASAPIAVAGALLSVPVRSWWGGLACCSLVAVTIVGGLWLASGLAPELPAVARLLAGAAVLIGLAATAATRNEHRRTVLLGFVVSGAVATAVGVLGYAGAVILGASAGADAPFVHVGEIPLAGKLPRLTGLLGDSPQRMGEYLVVLLAVGLGLPDQDWRPRLRWLRGPAIGLTSLALVLTFSHAWVGGLLVAGGYALISQQRSPPIRVLVVVALVASLAASFWLVNVGLPAPEAPGKAVAGGPCDEFDMEHTVVLVTDPDRALCRPLLAAGAPYPAYLTTYLHAKRTALVVFSAFPWTGSGAAGYAAAADDVFDREFGGLFGSRYDSPHCTYLHAIATAGIPGGLALVLFLWAVWRARPGGRRDEPSEVTRARIGPWLGVVALLAIGVNIDILSLRHFWFMVGLLAACDFVRPASRAEASPPHAAPPLS
jgi:hypothetical protein